MVRNLILKFYGKILLYKNSIEIYSGKGISFFGKDEQIATTKSLEYWKRFFTRLEHELNIILIKPRSRNIRIVNQHYAKPNSEIYKNILEKTGKHIKIYAKEDGKLAFVTDDSFGMREDETVHPKTAKSDRGAIDKQINDWRLNNPPTSSELHSNQQFLTNALTVQTRNINRFVESEQLYGEHHRTHIQAINKLGNGVNKNNLIMERILDLLKKFEN
jgi:hypothetical protein